MFIFEVSHVLMLFVVNWNAKLVFEVFYVLVLFVGSKCKIHFWSVSCTIVYLRILAMLKLFLKCFVCDYYLWMIWVLLLFLFGSVFVWHSYLWMIEVLSSFSWFWFFFILEGTTPIIVEKPKSSFTSWKQNQSSTMSAPWCRLLTQNQLVMYLIHN